MEWDAPILWRYKLTNNPNTWWRTTYVPWEVQWKRVLIILAFRKALKPSFLKTIWGNSPCYKLLKFNWLLGLVTSISTIWSPSCTSQHGNYRGKLSGFPRFLDDFVGFVQLVESGTPEVTIGQYWRLASSYCLEVLLTDWSPVDLQLYQKQPHMAVSSCTSHTKHLAPFPDVFPTPIPTAIDPSSRETDKWHTAGDRDR